MRNKRAEVELCEAILALIELKRFEAGDDSLGALIEKWVLDQQIGDFEHEILENAGAFEPLLVPIRRNRAHSEHPISRNA